MNAGRLRALQTWVEDNPGLLDLTTFGEATPRGITADLAGWTLLLNGWDLIADNTFLHREDGREVSGWEQIEREASAVLGLTEDDEWGHSDLEPLFAVLDRETALKRLGELTEQAEAAGAVKASA